MRDEGFAKIGVPHPVVRLLHGWATETASSEDDVDILHLGLLGEYALASWAGVPMRLILPGQFGDGGWDVGKNGRRLQAKASRYESPRLIENEADLLRHRCDAYVLVGVQLSVLWEREEARAVGRLLGWIEAADFIAGWEPIETPRGPRCTPLPGLLRTDGDGLRRLLARPDPWEPAAGVLA